MYHNQGSSPQFCTLDTYCTHSPPANITCFIRNNAIPFKKGDDPRIDRAFKTTSGPCVFPTAVKVAVKTDNLLGCRSACLNDKTCLGFEDELKFVPPGIPGTASYIDYYSSYSYYDTHGGDCWVYNNGSKVTPAGDFDTVCSLHMTPLAVTFFFSQATATS